jgi:hypothetical protein
MLSFRLVISRHFSCWPSTACATVPLCLSTCQVPLTHTSQWCVSVCVFARSYFSPTSRLRCSISPQPARRSLSLSLFTALGAPASRPSNPQTSSLRCSVLVGGIEESILFRSTVCMLPPRCFLLSPGSRSPGTPSDPRGVLSWVWRLPCRHGSLGSPADALPCSASDDPRSSSS